MQTISRFFQRIGIDPQTKIEKSVDFLGLVQTNCVLHIAYENLDILAKKPLDLDPKALYEKIVLRGRGGYCFELNGLLIHMLQEMGFTVSNRFARFLRGEDNLPMRCHRIVIVHMEDGDYLCDIGVGQIAPRLPLKIEEDLIQTQNGETYRFAKDDHYGWVLWELHKGAWRKYICFADDIVYDIDFQQPTFYCENHPNSRFNKKYILAIKTETGRRTIEDHIYKVFNGEELLCMEENLSDSQLQHLFRNKFYLTV